MKLSYRWISRNILKRPLLAILTSLFIAFLCFIPSKNIPNDITGDKTAHFLAFAALGFLWMEFSMNLIRTFSGLILFAIFIEIVQDNLPMEFHRSFDYFDIISDVVGIVLGYGIYEIEDWINREFIK